MTIMKIKCENIRTCMYIRVCTYEYMCVNSKKEKEKST